MNAETLSTTALKFRLVPIDDIDFSLGSTDLVRGLLPRTGLGVIYGPPGSGKSFVALDVALHIALGRRWAGQRVEQAGVVFVAAEGAEGFRRRVAAARKRLAAWGAPFGMIAATPNLGMANGDTDALVAAIRAHAFPSAWSPGVVVLDTTARVIAGIDENSAKEMGVFVANADRISRELRCLVLAVHHAGKSAEAGMRGSSALHGAADVEWSISAENGVRTIRLVKSKDGADNATWNFGLDVVEIGQDDEGEPITTCVVSNVTEPTFGDGGKQARRMPVPSSQRLFITAFDNALIDFGEDISPPGYGGSVRAVPVQAVRDEFIRSHAADEPASRRKAFTRALGAASSSKLILSADVGSVGYLWRSTQ